MPLATYQAVQRASCSSGLTTKLRDKLATLKDLKKGLAEAITESEQSINSERFWRNVEVATVFVAATCDVLVTAYAGPATGALYDVSKLIIDAFNKELTLKKALVYSSSAKVDAVEHILEISGSGKGASVVKSLKVLGQAVDDIYEIVTKREDGDRNGLVSSKKTAISLLQRIERQISQVEIELQNCGFLEKGTGLLLTRKP